MWQLIINGPGYFDTTYDLPEGVTTLGRADENDIVLSGDLVSRRHARITAAGDALSIEDLGSRNGSKLNGQPLHGTAELKTGDTVAVGENTLSIRQPTKVENAATEMVNLSAGGVRRFGEGLDISAAVVIAKNVKDSVVLRALDNVLPFSNPFGDDSPAPPKPDATPVDSPLVAKAQAGSNPLAYESLVVLYKTAEALGTAPSLQSFLDQTVDRVIQRVRGTTAVVLLRHHSGAMVPAAVRHRGKLAQGEVPVSDAVIHEALAKGAAIAVSDVRDDARFAQRESVLLYGVDQVLCVPLGQLGQAGQGVPFAGVLYVNKQAGDQAELEELLDLCTAVGHLIAGGVAKFRSDDRGRSEDRVRKVLERHHPPEVVEKRLHEIEQDKAAFTRLEPKQVSLVVAEIAGLGALGAKTDAATVSELLAEFHQRMTGIVFSFEGTIVHFAAESVVAAFGAPYSRGDDALRAVRAAMTMRGDWLKGMRRRPAPSRTELRVLVHSGKVLAGLVGQEPRVEFAAVGDPLSAASLLVSTLQPGVVAITGKTLTAVGARFDVNPLGERTVRPGEKVPVFEVLEEDVPVHTNPGLR